MKKHILLLASVALALLLAVSSCAKKDAAKAAPQISAIAVSTTFAEQRSIADYLGLSGDIVSGSSVDTYSDAAGKVTRLYVAVGDRVARNAPLVEVDPSRPGMTYRAAIVRSPIAGTVTALPAQIGMTVAQTVPVCRIAGSGALEIRLYVAERFISKIALGLPCEITLDAWPGETFRGSIREVSPTVDAASRTMEIKVNVENPGARLKSGMFAKVKIITERKDGAVTIPENAMQQRFGETYVYVAEADRNSGGGGSSGGYLAHKRIVKPGIAIDGILEVAEGLREGEEVIVKGMSLLEDGARVTIIKYGGANVICKNGCIEANYNIYRVCTPHRARHLRPCESSARLNA
jgi:multidrug efflux pump subunit AcrA (membrane-fusion protein)